MLITGATIILQPLSPLVYATPILGITIIALCIMLVSTHAHL